MKSNDYPTERDLADEKWAGEAVQNLTSFVNKYTCPEKVFAKLMMNEHRTLQQSTMRLFENHRRVEQAGTL